MIVETHERDCCACELIEETRAAKNREPAFGEMYLCGLLVGRYEARLGDRFVLAMCPLHFAKWNSYLVLAEQRKESA